MKNNLELKFHSVANSLYQKKAFFGMVAFFLSFNNFWERF